jgi:hypothetical protein
MNVELFVPYGVTKDWVFELLSVNALPSLPATLSTLTSVIAIDPTQPSLGKGATISPPKVPEIGKRNLKPSAAKAEVAAVRMNMADPANLNAYIFFIGILRGIELSLTDTLSVICFS